MEKLGQVQLNDRKILVEEVVRMLPYTTVTLLGPSGTGKTTFAEEIAKDERLGIDKLVILRLQGLCSEDFRIPTLQEEINIATGEKTNKKIVEFAKIGIFKEIVDNPQTKYLLFLDEILRADANVAPLLFELLERKIDGVYRDNLYIITCANYGDGYISNIDYSDSALRRRQIFIEYIPQKEDIVDFMIKKQYHPLILELMEYLDICYILNHDQSSKDLEQDTQLGSWDLLNKRWKSFDKEPGEYQFFKEDLLRFGSYFFSDYTITEMLNRITILEEMKEINIQKEIIENNALNDDDYLCKLSKKVKDKIINKRKDMLTKTKQFVKGEYIKDNTYFDKNILNICRVFVNDIPYLNALLIELKKIIYISKEENDASKEWSRIQLLLVKQLQNESKKNEEIKKVFEEIRIGISLAA